VQSKFPCPILVNQAEDVLAIGKTLDLSLGRRPEVENALFYRDRAVAALGQRDPKAATESLDIYILMTLVKLCKQDSSKHPSAQDITDVLACNRVWAMANAATALQKRILP
jgi:hypothetical protein